ncbi:unnamed protein product, partial [Bubo scandiacus]
MSLQTGNQRRAPAGASGPRPGLLGLVPRPAEEPRGTAPGGLEGGGGARLTAVAQRRAAPRARAGGSVPFRGRRAAAGGGRGVCVCVGRGEPSGSAGPGRAPSAGGSPRGPPGRFLSLRAPPSPRPAAGADRRRLRAELAGSGAG